MRMLNLRIRGAIGLRPYGEEVSIDLSRFEPGFIALVGPNGAGKTTLLESLQPWPYMMSYGGFKGKYSDNFYLRDSFREFEFEYCGDKYLCKMAIDAQRDKADYFLYCGNDPLNDGKKSTYIDEVKKMFGTKELFFKSIFHSQEGSKIAELTEGEMKTFFLELMGLDRFGRFVEHIKGNNSKNIPGEIPKLQSERDKINMKIEGIQQAIEFNKEKLADRAGIEEEIAGYKKEIPRVEKDLERARKDLDTLKEKAAKLEQYRKRLDELKDEKEALAGDILNLQGERDKARSEITSQINGIDNEIAGLQKNLEEADTIKKNAGRLKELQGEYEELSAGKSQIQELELKRNNIQAQIDADSAELRNTITIKKSRLESLNKEIDGIRRDRQASIDLLKEKLQRAEKTASELEGVPCKDTPEFVATCPLISSAREAREKIEQLKSDLVKAEQNLVAPIPETDERNKLSIDVEKDEHKLEHAHPKDFEIDQIEKMIDAVDFDPNQFDSVREEIEILKKTDWQTLLNRLDKAEITIEERRKKKEDLESRNDQIINEYANRIAAIEVKRKATNNKIEEIGAKIEVDPLREIKEKETQIELLQDQLNNQRSAISGLESKIDTLNQLEAETEKLTADRNQLLEEKKKIDSDISDWKWLSKHLGKDGLQAILLEDASPEISDIATEIMQLFGPGWSVSIRTVRASADGKSDIETFEILISRPLPNGSCEIVPFGKLSGGQKVWAAEAISKGVTIYLLKHTGRDYQTLFQDEGDGALDPEKAEAFYHTAIRAQQFTGVRNTVIITQRPSIWEQIPQGIHLDPEKGEIRLVA
ncbi:MAG: AAA family ATPase [Candidatus Zixiibacteriota bacterium]|nr:MAG: AAA family ATPase [candidate division Zixibacteria bacterium]